MYLKKGEKQLIFTQKKKSVQVGLFLKKWSGKSGVFRVPQGGYFGQPGGRVHIAIQVRAQVHGGSQEDPVDSNRAPQEPQKNLCGAAAGVC